MNKKNFNEEPKLIFDNDQSFTKEIDNMMRKDINYAIKDSRLNILMVAEKPSIAKIISQILSDNKCQDDSIYSLNIFTFEGYFKGIKLHFTKTSVKGHIYNNKYEEDIKPDEQVESYEYNIVKERENKRINIPKFLRYLGRGKDILCLWIDCDPEG